jgi:hypothetical protein
VPALEPRTREKAAAADLDVTTTLFDLRDVPTTHDGQHSRARQTEPEQEAEEVTAQSAVLKAAPDRGSRSRGDGHSAAHWHN